jgi:hypothetical protein
MPVLALLGTLDAAEAMAHTHRLEAVACPPARARRRPVAARESYLRAAKMTASVPEQRYLNLRAARLRQAAIPPAEPELSKHDGNRGWP